MVRIPNLHLVQGAVGFLAVAGDEGDGAALVYQGDDGADLLHADSQLICNPLHDVHFIDHEGIDAFLCKFHEKITPASVSVSRKKDQTMVWPKRVRVILLKKGDGGQGIVYPHAIYDGVPGIMFFSVKNYCFTVTP